MKQFQFNTDASVWPTQENTTLKKKFGFFLRSYDINS